SPQRPQPHLARSARHRAGRLVPRSPIVPFQSPGPETRKARGLTARRLPQKACPAARRPALRAFPFGGSRTACRRAVRVTPSSADSHEGSVLLGVLYATGSRGRWVPRSRHGLGLSTGSSGVSPSAVPRKLTFTGSSSLELSASSRVRATCDLPSVPRKTSRPSGSRRAPPLGLRPSSRHQQAASTWCPRFPGLELWSVLDVSHVLDGLLRHLPCGFVSPRSHVQRLPFRGLSLSAEPCRVSPADSCPLAVERRRLRCDPRQ